MLYLEVELFIKDRVERVSEHFGLAGFVFVRDDVDFDVWVWVSSQVHALQAVGLFDPDRELLKQKPDSAVAFSKTGS